MLSVIFYGRNDNHGYNLHKRASLSLNNVAELLTHQDDEILFVDWNTQFGLPTFVEAIADTLTEKAKNLIKIIKVGAEIHEKLFKKLTKKELIEPVARNVAIRRSHPRNEWLLSTNLDMIFDLNDAHSLNEILKELPIGYYGIPRFSLPEIYWDNLPRGEPQVVINRIKKDRDLIDLEEIVEANNIILYDAPGDFQLFTRDQAFLIQGFDERMIHGWHVDSNLAKRFFLLNGSNASLIESVRGYHCEHTKLPTHFTSSSVQNSLIDYYEQVDTPILNQPDWGLGSYDLNTSKLNEIQKNKMNTILTFSKMQTKRDSIYANDMGNLITYPFEHSAPYIIDALETVNSEWTILYFGRSDENFKKLCNLIYTYRSLNLIKIESSNFDHYFETLKNEKYVLIIADFGLDTNFSEKSISRLRHTDTGMSQFNSIREVFEDLLTFLIKQNLNENIYTWPILSINAETYDFGVGSTLRRWISQPSVAANSRVRSGYLRRNASGHDSNILMRLMKKDSKRLYPISIENFKEIEIDHRALEKDFFITGHQIYYFLLDPKEVTINPRGVFLREEGQLSFRINSNIHHSESFDLLLEFDKPKEDHFYSSSFLSLTTEFCTKEFLFNTERSDCSYIILKNLGVKDISNLVIEYKTTNSSNLLESVRFINFGIVKSSEAYKYKFLEPSKLSSRKILECGFSYSNESEQRWTTAEIAIIKIERKCRLLVLDLNFPAVEVSDLEIKLNKGDSSKFTYNFRRLFFFKRHLYIFIQNNQDQEIEVLVQYNKPPFRRFELSKRDSRKLFFSIKSIFVSNIKMNPLHVALLIIIRSTTRKIINKLI